MQQNASKNTAMKLCDIYTDNGGEFVIHELSSYCFTNGIIHQTTSAYQHESYSTMEHYNRTLQHIVRHSLTHSSVPLFYQNSVTLPSEAIHPLNSYTTKANQASSSLWSPWLHIGLDTF